MMSKEGPIISVVVLRAKGKAIEKVFLCQVRQNQSYDLYAQVLDMSPKTNAIATELGGSVSFVGQLADGVVLELCYCLLCIECLLQVVMQQDEQDAKGLIRNSHKVRLFRAD